MEKARINPIIAEYEAKKAEEKKQRELEHQKEIERMRVNGEALEEYLVNGMKPILDAAVTIFWGLAFRHLWMSVMGKTASMMGKKNTSSG